jgi:hypothetical protein
MHSPVSEYEVADVIEAYRKKKAEKEDEWVFSV